MKALEKLQSSSRVSASIHSDAIKYCFSGNQQQDDLTEKRGFTNVLIGGPCGADLDSAKAAARSRAAKKNAARKAKKVAEGEAAPSVASLTNGFAKTR